MDPETYRKRLIEIRDSKVELKRLIGEFPMDLILELDSHILERKWRLLTSK